MYKIIGADQQTYGPVPAETVREWIATRRANGSTQIQAEGDSEWKPLSAFAEFRDALAAAPPPTPVGAPPPLPSASAPMPPPSPQRKTSGLAIASLVCGVLGCAGITAIAGVILGIIALAKINRSNGRLGGFGLAVAGICVSGFMLITIPIFAGLMLPALAKAKGKAQAVNCANNLRQLALAARMYANDSDNTFPDGEKWCDLLQKYASQRAFHCPSHKGALCSYGFNSALSKRAEADIHPATVLFYEIPGGWNVTGGPEQMIHQPRHHTVNVAFADGSVRQMRQDRVHELRWEP